MFKFLDLPRLREEEEVGSPFHSERSHELNFLDLSFLDQSFRGLVAHAQSFPRTRPTAGYLHENEIALARKLIKLMMHIHEGTQTQVRTNKSFFI